MTTAALGGDMEVPTLDGGKTRVKIPQGSQNNKQLRLKEKECLQLEVVQTEIFI